VPKPQTRNSPQVAKPGVTAGMRQGGRLRSSYVRSGLRLSIPSRIRADGTRKPVSRWSLPGHIRSGERGARALASATGSGTGLPVHCPVRLQTMTAPARPGRRTRIAPALPSTSCNLNQGPARGPADKPWALLHSRPAGGRLRHLARVFC
jgi:hypothetical protein